MKKLIIVILLLLVHIVAWPVFAHIDGQSIFKINGVNTAVEKSMDINAIDELQDVAPENYTVGQKLLFDLDISKFPTPKTIFEKTDLTWDFGDGTPKQTITYGITNTHAYAKPGTYTLTIYADYTSAGFTIEPQLLQSAVITIEDKESKQSQMLFYFLPTILVIVVLFLVIRKKRKKHYK